MKRADEDAVGLRVPIRFKILALVGLTLIASMVAYLLLATDLITKDKLAYVFDLNSTLAKTLGEQVGAAMGSMEDKLRYTTRIEPSGECSRS